jgi:hypothetical protein
MSGKEELDCSALISLNKVSGKTMYAEFARFETSHMTSGVVSIERKDGQDSNNPSSKTSEVGELALIPGCSCLFSSSVKWLASGTIGSPVKGSVNPMLL